MAEVTRTFAGSDVGDLEDGSRGGPVPDATTVGLVVVVSVGVLACVRRSPRAGRAPDSYSLSWESGVSSGAARFWPSGTHADPWSNQEEPMSGAKVQVAVNGFGVIGKRVADIQVAGTLGGLLGIWQGGDKHELTGYSFCAQVDHTGALNRGFARVVSCNTTCDGHVAPSPVTTTRGGPHDRGRPALDTGWRA